MRSCDEEDINGKFETAIKGDRAVRTRMVRVDGEIDGCSEGEGGRQVL